MVLARPPATAAITEYLQQLAEETGERCGRRLGGDGGSAGIANRKPLHSALGFPTLSVVSTLGGPRGPGMHGGGPLMHVDP